MGSWTTLRVSFSGKCRPGLREKPVPVLPSSALVLSDEDLGGKVPKQVVGYKGLRGRRGRTEGLQSEFKEWLGQGACIKVKSPLSKRLAKARCIKFTVSGSGWFEEPVRKGFRATSCLADEALAPDLGYASRVSAC